MADNVKRPIIPEDPEPEKKVRWAEPVLHGKAPLAWRFSSADRIGPFGWAFLREPQFKQVIDKLQDFELKTWDQITAKGSHSIAVSDLEKPARDRLAEIQQDDLDELMSFRLTGKNRVWCRRVDNIMKVLWWDPEHKVCKAEKDKADRVKRHNRK